MRAACRTVGRLDRSLVEAGLFGSRQRAQAAVAAGLVRVNGAVTLRPSAHVDPGDLLEAKDPLPFVSRGGLKLAAALDHFHLPVEGRLAVDVGASTGGFSDVLLQRGAGRIYAVDVGTGQLASGLRADPRVVNLEGTDIRRLPPASLLPPPDLAVVDVAFISLRLVLPHTLAQLDPTRPADVVALVKPQFEVGREGVGKGGVVRHAEYRRRALRSVLAAAQDLGLALVGTLPSPIPGGDGNAEYLAYWTFAGTL